MAKTKSQIIAWLDAQVGKSIDAASAPYTGQCVSLCKALFNFLGVPNAYAARGNAREAGDNYLKAGICDNNSAGWLRICVNRTMAAPYGHIWVDISNLANYEQNGARALYVTKNTRPISQAHQIISVKSQYVLSDQPVTPPPVTPALPGSRVPQNGTFKANYDMKIRWEPGLNGKFSGVIMKKGETRKYDSYIDKDGIRWISYMGTSGNRCYVARRTLDNKTIWGDCY